MLGLGPAWTRSPLSSLLSFCLEARIQIFNPSSPAVPSATCYASHDPIVLLSSALDRHTPALSHSHGTVYALPQSLQDGIDPVRHHNHRVTSLREEPVDHPQGHTLLFGIKRRSHFIKQKDFSRPMAYLV